MELYCGTSIVDPPVFTGPAGQAWRVTLPPVDQRARPDWNATLDICVVRLPGAHICWDHWIVSVIHLRPIAGVKPAHVSQEGATHELVIASLDPTQPLPSLDATDDANWLVHTLRPIDVIEQFTAADDAVAHKILELAVRAIVDGYGSPDQDWRAWWKNAVATTSEHFAAGVHSSGSQH